jgi:hypothetical protein
MSKLTAHLKWHKFLSNVKCFTIWNINFHVNIKIILGALDSIVAEALWYKLEGRGFKTWWGELIFSIHLIFPAALGPGVYSASNRN